MYYTTFTSQLCPITLIGDEDGLQRLYMHTTEEKYPLCLNEDWIEDRPFFDQTIKELNAYLTGNLKAFSIKLNPKGTDYQKRAWKALREIPYGAFRTYKEQAISCGNPNAYRAVGAANSKNPIPIIVPCHRVIGSNGQLTGFAFGIEWKKALLDIEGLIE